MSTLSSPTQVFSCLNTLSFKKYLTLALMCLLFTTPLLCAKSKNKSSQPDTKQTNLQDIVPEQINTKLTKQQNIPPEEPPQIVIGILSLTMGSNLTKIISHKVTRGEIDDFTVSHIQKSQDPLKDVIVSDPKNGEKILFSEVNYILQVKQFIMEQLRSPQNLSYIANSYRQFLESYNNVIVKIIDINLPTSQLADEMANLDGILLTGGSNTIATTKKLVIDVIKNDQKSRLYAMNLPTEYMSKVRLLIEMAKAINQTGREFIIWGTCLGFESMMVAQASYTFMFDEYQKDKNVMHSLVGIQAPSTPQNKQTDNGINAKTQWTDLSAETTENFDKLISDQISPFWKEKLFFYNHKYGISLKNFLSDQLLRDNIIPLALSDTDEFGWYSVQAKKNLPQSIQKMTADQLLPSTYIAAIRYKNFPFYATQFHPEKPLYDFKNNPAVVRFEESQQANKKFSDFFVNRLRLARERNSENGFMITQMRDTSVMFSIKNAGIYEEIHVF